MKKLLLITGQMRCSGDFIQFWQGLSLDQPVIVVTDVWPNFLERRHALILETADDPAFKVKELEAGKVSPVLIQWLRLLEAKKFIVDTIGSDLEEYSVLKIRSDLLTDYPRLVDANLGPSGSISLKSDWVFGCLATDFLELCDFYNHKDELIARQDQFEDFVEVSPLVDSDEIAKFSWLRKKLFQFQLFSKSFVVHYSLAPPLAGFSSELNFLKFLLMRGFILRGFNGIKIELGERTSSRSHHVKQLIKDSLDTCSLDEILANSPKFQGLDGSPVYLSIKRSQNLHIGNKKLEKAMFYIFFKFAIFQSKFYSRFLKNLKVDIKPMVR